MKIATFSHEGHRQVGVVEQGDQYLHALDLSTYGPLASGEMLALIAGMAGGLIPVPARGRAIPIGEVALQAPIPRPRRNIFCVGRNYHAHAKELSGSVFKGNDAAVASWPIVFTKVPECVVGPAAEVVIPARVSEQIDYEAELAVVIGRGGKNIGRGEAMSHVFGYTIVNDVTARDVQMRHAQWDLGKSFDTFCPMGPWIVTADEMDGTDTRVRCWVNGELRQDGLTKDLIFDIPTLIETCSRAITLFPGDIIATGTPAGVGMGMEPPQYLKGGDVVKIAIDGIGTIENRFV